MKKHNKFIIYLALISAIIFYIYYMFDSVEIDEKFIHQYNFDSYIQVDDSPLVYKVTYNDQTGYLIFWSETGYQSNIIMASLIGDDGVLINTKTYSEKETPAFFLRLTDADFFEVNFGNIGIDDGFSADSNVDIVSGATVSSKAVTRAVHQSVSHVGDHYLDIQVIKQHNTMEFGVVEATVIVMLLLAYLSYRFVNKFLRTLTLLYSFVLMGIKFMQFISYSTFISAVTFKFPNIYQNLNWYLLLIGSIVLVILTGKNLYCTYICPFGAMQQMAYKAAKLDFFKVSPNIKQYARLLPGYIAYFAFAVAMLTHNVSVTSYEPFSLVFGRVGIGVHWLLLPIVLIFPLLVMRYYCNFGCPVGFVWRMILVLRKKVVAIWEK